MGVRLILSRLTIVALSLLTSTCAAASDAVSVSVKNPLPAPRVSQTIALRLAELRKVAPALDPAKTVVVDAAGHPIASQLVDMDGDESPDEIVLQSDFAAGEAKTFTVQAGERRSFTRSDFKVYGRFVRERHDDFAWENDRIAHRMYGADLETWVKEPLTSSGVDIWAKRTSKLVINDWYMTDNYHQDNGDGGDFYSVGKSRGCGGLGIWQNGKLYVSRNFVTSRVLANGPIRLVFELGYAPWDAGGLRVAETKRVILDAGQGFDRFESVLKVDGQERSLEVAVGIANHKGGAAEVDPKGAWLRSWEPLKEPNGNIGCGVVVTGQPADYRPTDTDFLIVTHAKSGVPLVYYAGFGWDRGGSAADVASWTKKVDAFAREVAAPLQVSLAPSSPTAATSPSARPAQKAQAWSVRVCDSIMARSASGFGERWDYDTGLVLLGFEHVWRATRDRTYLDYMKRTVDRLVDTDGKIKGYELEKYNIDQINMGKVLFALLAESTEAKEKDRYRKALGLLRSQMLRHPRTTEGGFWHKGIYPHQMWLDGVYMASPFLAKYAVVFGEPAIFDDVAKQILLAEAHTRDSQTGLLYHGWDESREQRWSNPKTGTSPQFWGRAMGWYAMALVDVLELMPQAHPQRAAIVAVLGRLAAAVAAVQDKSTGVWWQVLDAGSREKNYREASASSMFVYALTKAIKNGWLDKTTYGPVAARGYQGILDQFVEIDGDGRVNVASICAAAGLGGSPYRDGSFEYYSGIDVVTNEPKGVGAFLLASAERE
jgi:unsaturated rhamnogalacturonyl hydrolase